MKSIIVFLLAAIGAVHAFVPTLRPKTVSTTFTLLSMNVPLNQIDEMCIENVAEICLEEAMTCDVEEFEALVNQLTTQRAYHTAQIALLDGLLDKLSAREDTFGEAINGSGQRSP